MEQYASIWPCYSFTPYLSVPYTDFKPPNLPEQLTFLMNKKQKSGYIPTYSRLVFTPHPSPLTPHLRAGNAALRGKFKSCICC